MRKKHFRALIALNALLLMGLAAISLAPSALAQRAATRARGDYTMVAGRIQGTEESAVYLVDSNNQEMVVLRWDRRSGGLTPIGRRSLKADAMAPAGGSR